MFLPKKYKPEILLPKTNFNNVEYQHTYIYSTDGDAAIRIFTENVHSPENDTVYAIKDRDIKNARETTPNGFLELAQHEQKKEICAWKIENLIQKHDSKFKIRIDLKLLNKIAKAAGGQDDIILSFACRREEPIEITFPGDVNVTGLLMAKKV
jgi:hypothetical protein